MGSPPHSPAYVAGTFQDTAERREIHSPYDGSVVGTVGIAGKADLERAIAAAVASADACRKLPTHVRATILKEVAVWIGAHKDELATLMVREGGKPISDAKGEVDRAVHAFETAAAECERPTGEVMPLDLRPTSDGRLGFTRRVPVGPVSAISPFNFPLNLVVHKLAPAIAAGCPIVLKPAVQTPLTSLKLAEAIDRTAWPKGALSIVPSDPEVADVLVTDPRMKLLSFTGSDKVGWELKARAGKKRVLLELGADSMVIVDEDADLSWAVPRIVYGAYGYAGQKCISVQHILVHERLYDHFLELFVPASAAAKVGDPAQPDVIVGPMIDARGADKVQRLIDDATKRGATALLAGPRQGNTIPPTILTDVPDDAAVMKEEAFGPVVTVRAFKTLPEAFARVNASRFGLQAGLFTEKLEGALSAWDDVEVGGLIVNDIPTYRIDPMPYGGVKDSGLGREGLRWAIEEMTELRLMVVNRRHRSV